MWRSTVEWRNAVLRGLVVFVFVCLACAIARAQEPEWEELDLRGDVPSPRLGHTITRVGDRIFVFGGNDGAVTRTDGARRNAFNDLYQYSEGSAEYGEITPAGDDKPPARDHHAAASADDKLFVFFGFGAAGPLGDVWCYNPATNRWDEQPANGMRPGARGFHSAVTLNGKIYVFGGLGPNFTRLNDTWEYNPGTNTWMQLANLPDSLLGHASTTVGTQILTFGGFGSQGLNGKLFQFCPDAQNPAWTELPLPAGQLPPTAFGNLIASMKEMSGTTVMTDLAMVGGENELGLQNDTAIVTSNSSTIDCLAEIPSQTGRMVPNGLPVTSVPAIEDRSKFMTSRRGDGTLVIVRSLFIFGGRMSNGQPTNRGFRLTLEERSPGPDLAGEWVSLTEKCKGNGANEKCKLKGTLLVLNVGDEQAGASTVSLFLSSDAVVDSGDTLLKQFSVAAIAVEGEARIAVKKVKLATGTNGSGRFVIAVLDDGDGITESDETNNAVVFGPLP